MDTIDDRGNVVDVYDGDDPTGRLDREAESIEGVEGEFSVGWVGSAQNMETIIANGLQDELALAIICGLLRKETDAEDIAKEFLRQALFV